MRRGRTVVLRVGLLLTLLVVLTLPSGTSRAAGLWTTVFFDDFTANTGWNVSPSGDATTGLCVPNSNNGNTWPAFIAFNYNWGGASTLSIIQNSAVRSSSPGNGGVVFGLVGRTGLFAGVPNGQTWAFELRWIWSYSTAYGTNIFLGSGNWDPNRYGDCSGNPHPDWLNAVHAHFRWDTNPCCQGGWIDVFGRRVYTITSRSVGEWWITLRVEVRPDGSWTAWVNGSQVGQGTGAFKPNLVAFGNFYEQSWWGNWTNLHIDYVKIETQAPITGSLSGPTDIARALGAVAFTISVSDPWGRLQQVRLFRSPVAYKSWQLLGTFACSGSSCWVTAWYDPGPDPPGLYWFVMDATTSDGRSCTGNVGSPGSTLYGEPLPAGITDCGPSSRMQVRLWDPVTFTGRVTRLGDGAGLSGVQIDACLDGWNCYRSVWTDGAGTYTLQEPRPWVWNGYAVVDLVVRPPGGYGAWSAGPGTAPGSVLNAQTIRYPVSARGSFGGYAYGNNNYVLAWWITFTGRVYNRTTGAGMGGVTVVFRLDGWNQVGSVTTDGAGNYAWSYLGWPPDGYSFLDIVVQPPANWVSAQAGPATSPGYVVNAQTIRYPVSAVVGWYGGNNFALDGQYAFSGRVTRKGDGAGLAGVTVRLLRESDGAVLAQVQTDGAGNYTLGWQGYAAWNLLLRVLPPAGYVADTASSASGGQVLAADTLRFGAGTQPGSYGGNNYVLGWPTTFTGRVYNRTTGAGMGGATIFFRLDGTTTWGSVTTDGAGNYAWTTTAWPPGGYSFLDIVVQPPVNWTAAQAGPGTAPGSVVNAWTIRYPVTASGGTTYGNNNFGLDGLYAFSGRVTRKSDGVGLAGVTVRLLRESDGALLAQAQTDGNGNYAVTWQGYPTTNLLLRVVVPAFYVADAASSTSGGQVLGADTIRFGAGLAPGVYGGNTYVLAGQATFSGRVTRRSDGAALAGVIIRFWVGSGTLVGEVQTDGTGAYTWTHPNWPVGTPLDITVHPPANYQAVGATAPPPGQALNTWTIRYPATTAPGSYPDNNFTLAGVVTWSGQVVRFWDGRGVAGATVQLLLNGAQLLAQTTTDAAGFWSLTYTDWPVGGFVDLLLVPPAGYLPSAATAPPPGQVIDARTIRYAGTVPVGSYPNNVYRLTVPPPPPPGGTVGGGQGTVAACQGPCLILQGGRLSPPAAGLQVTVQVPPNRDDITQLEVELRHVDPADGRVDRYLLPVGAGQTQVVVDRTTTGDPTLGEKAVGTWEVWARFRSVAPGPGAWATLGRYTVLWLPARISQ